MKDGLISKLLITETGHRPTQFKKITDTLPVLYTDKNFWGFNEDLLTGRDLVETDCMPIYPDATQLSNTHQMEIQTVNPTANVVPNTGLRPPITIVVQKSHVFDANLQKWLLLQYKQNSKIKSEEYAKFVANKKALITIIFGQCDEATNTKISLEATYTADRQVGNLIEFIKRLPTVFLAVMTVAYHMGPINKL